MSLIGSLMFRILVSHLVTLLIALQSVVAVADTHQITVESTEHQMSQHQAHQHGNFQQHQFLDLSALNDIDMVIADLQDNERSHQQQGQHSDNHPDCHQGHCHHASQVFWLTSDHVFTPLVKAMKVSQLQVNPLATQIAPPLRPPIV